MCSGFSALLLQASIILMLALGSSAGDLRVCADPNNLPYSNAAGQGYEVELAQLAARDLGARVQFVWAAQRGKFLEKTLDAGKCDVIMSIPSSVAEVRTTHPYYRSSYVFVSRRDRSLDIQSFNDARLRNLRIGVQILQNEAGSATPPAQALIDRQLSNNIVWYKIFPDFSRSTPAAALIEGVVRGDIDVAVAWGPLAGYCARQVATPLDIENVSPASERSLPLAFDISMGVRASDTELCSKLNAFIEQRGPEIRALLKTYGVPLDDRRVTPASVAQSQSVALNQ
jgi:mxaJ protein